MTAKTMSETEETEVHQRLTAPAAATLPPCPEGPRLGGGCEYNEIHDGAGEGGFIEPPSLRPRPPVHRHPARHPPRLHCRRRRRPHHLHAATAARHRPSSENTTAVDDQYDEAAVAVAAATVASATVIDSATSDDYDFYSNCYYFDSKEDNGSPPCHRASPRCCPPRLSPLTPLLRDCCELISEDASSCRCHLIPRWSSSIISGGGFDGEDDDEATRLHRHSLSSLNNPTTSPLSPGKKVSVGARKMFKSCRGGGGGGVGGGGGGGVGITVLCLISAPGAFEIRNEKLLLFIAILHKFP